MFYSSTPPPRTSLPVNPDSKTIKFSPAYSRGLSRFRPGWLREPPLLAIDIGTAAIKLVELRRSRGSIVLGKLAITETPVEVLSGGALTNSIAAAGALREALRVHRIRSRRAALAVGGAKARAQSEAAPAECFESEDALGAYVERTASSEIGSDVDFAALDFHTVATPGKGPRTVLWAASGRVEVDWARQAAALAGRVPVLIEPRACSLVNAYVFNHQPADGAASLLLHAGARWLTMALVLDGMLLYSLDLPLRHSGGANRSSDSAAVLGTLWPYLHEFARRAAPATIERVVMSGAARADQCGEAIHRRTGLMVQQIDPFRRITHLAGGPQCEIVREWGPLFSVAVGLALRRFEEL